MFLVKQETNLSLHSALILSVSLFSLSVTYQIHMFQSDDIKKPSHYAIKKNTERHGIKVITKKKEYSE